MARQWQNKVGHQQAEDVNAAAQAAYEKVFGEIPDHAAHVTLLEFVANIKTVAYQAKLQDRKVNLASDRRIELSGITEPQVTDREYNRSKAALIDLSKTTMREGSKMPISTDLEKAMGKVINSFEREVFKLASLDTHQLVQEYRQEAKGESVQRG